MVCDQDSDRVYSIPIRRGDLKSFYTMTTLSIYGLAQDNVDFPALFYKSGRIWLNEIFCTAVH